jgi:hypothetical protein
MGTHLVMGRWICHENRTTWRVDLACLPGLSGRDDIDTWYDVFEGWTSRRWNEMSIDRFGSAGLDGKMNTYVGLSKMQVASRMSVGS